MSTQTYRITVEKVDEDGEPAACAKTSCSMCEDKKQVEVLTLSVIASPQELREQFKQAVCRAMDAMRRAGG